MNRDFHIFRPKQPIATASDLNEMSTEPLDQAEQRRLVEDLVPEVRPLQYRDYTFGKASLLFLPCDRFLSIHAKGLASDIYPILERFRAAGLVVYDCEGKDLVAGTPPIRQ